MSSIPSYALAIKPPAVINNAHSSNQDMVIDLAEKRQNFAKLSDEENQAN